MLRLNNFLFFDLEIGGKIVAWLGMARYAFFMGLLFVVMFIGVIFPCEHTLDQLNKVNIDHELLQQCHITKTAIVVILTTTLAFFSAMFYVYYALYEGIKNKCVRQIIPGIIYEFIALFLSLLCFIVCYDLWQYIGVVVVNVINAFFIWTLLSIHEKFKNEGATSCGPIYYQQK